MEFFIEEVVVVYEISRGKWLCYEYLRVIKVEWVINKLKMIYMMIRERFL